MNCGDCKFWEHYHGAWGYCSNDEVSEMVRGMDPFYGADCTRKDFGCIKFEARISDTDRTQTSEMGERKSKA